MDTQRKPLLQLKGCTIANSKIQEIWETDPSWQASIRTKHLFISFLVTEPWQTLHFHILIWAFIPFLWVVLGLFFFNHKVSLYLLAFSKLQLPTAKMYMASLEMGLFFPLRKRGRKQSKQELGLFTSW